MPIPETFQFSQASLQDAVDCRRRFQLRYLLELAWPAIEAEPADEYEAHIRDGEAFHRLIHQHQLGLPADRLASQAGDASYPRPEGESRGGLAAWWAGYLADAPAGLPDLRYPEVALSAPVGSHRLLARYDLVAVEPGRRAVIVDWKTSARRSTGAWLAGRLQTRVYRYLLVQAGSHLNGGQPIGPEQVEMVYWFAAFPDQPERLRYDRTQFAADGRYLASLIGELASTGEDDFPLTADATRCRFCPYRSLCGRGAEAGDMAGDEAGPEPAAEPIARLDFEQVAEVAF